MRNDCTLEYLQTTSAGSFDNQPLFGCYLGERSIKKGHRMTYRDQTEWHQ